jgi:cytochrome P450
MASLRPGEQIGTNDFIVNRDKEIFGEEADVFRPERWLVNEES